MKRTVPTLAAPTAFLTLEELATRWRRQPVTVNRLLRKFGIPTYRLTAAGHLYALKDIEAIEEQARGREPLPGRSNFRKEAAQ